MTSSSCEADVHNWDDRKDDLSGALEHAEKVRQKRVKSGFWMILDDSGNGTFGPSTLPSCSNVVPTEQ